MGTARIIARPDRADSFKFSLRSRAAADETEVQLD